MGAQIAALLSGCLPADGHGGFRVRLLDILPPKGPDADEQQAGLSIQDPRWRNKIVAASLERLRKLKPSPLYLPGDLNKIHIGNFEDDLTLLADCDWVIEAVVERLDIKHELYQRIAPFLGAKAVLTSNTSGLLWSQLAHGMDPQLKRRFFITHFFNPPRYLKLVEIVAGDGTDKAIVERIAQLLEMRLGKGGGGAKGTPNFVANPIG